MLKFLKLIRFNNLLILFVTQLLTRVCIIGKNDSFSDLLSDVHFFILALSTMLVAAGGYIINDYYDIKIDLLNKPDKLVVGKFISRRIALTWHLSLSIAGILLGFYNGYLIGCLHMLSAFLLWLYSNN